MASITVVGAGYVGLVSSACFAWLGHRVRCVEPDVARFQRLQSGCLPVREPGLQRLVKETSSDGRLSFTGGVEESLEGSEFAIVAVPTPMAPGGQADLRAVMSVAGSIAEHADDGMVVVVKSTVPVGTGDHLAGMLSDGMPVVSNPEFLREGSAVDDFLNPERIVIGAERPETAEAVASLYADIPAPVIMCDRRSAELAKYAANAYLATRLSFVNEIARICAATGADIDRVTEVMAADHRIGPHYLKTGIGWGGSCLPKDVSALADMARQAGAATFMLQAAQESNSAQVDFLVETLERELGGMRGRVIGIAGTAFKAGTDDVRESPSLAVARRLAELGATVRAHDPVALAETATVAGDYLQCVESVSELTAGADAVIIATDWPEYVATDWDALAGGMRGDVMFDARNALSAGLWQGGELRYFSYGRRIGRQKR